MTARFGLLIEPVWLPWSAGRIEPLQNHGSTVEGVLAHDRHYAGCLYPPLAGVTPDSNESKECPAVPAIFGMPPTHELTLFDSPTDPAAEDFFIALFGMLKGLRLQREGWQHFYRCPTKRGALCDFYADNTEIATTLDQAAIFWRSHTDPLIRKLVFGAIHWHLFAQLYQHEFERFNAQYTALDACWALAKEMLKVDAKGLGHADRPRTLATALGLLIPNWAAPLAANQKACSLSVRRNALVHEAMYAGEPIGFAHSQTERGMETELTGFVARAIFALLGVHNEYTRSRGDTGQCIGFSHLYPV